MGSAADTIVKTKNFSLLADNFKDLSRVELLLMILMSFLFAGFFFLPTAPHRIILYLSFLVFAVFAFRQRACLFSGLPDKRFFAALGVFLGYFALSCFWSFDADVERVVQKLKVAPFILVFGLMLHAILKRRPGFWRVLKGVFVLSALVTGVLLIVLNYNLFRDIADGQRLEGWGRAENSVQCGLLYGLALIVLLTTRSHVLAFMNSNAAKALISLVFLTVMVLSVSRGPLLALLLVYGTWLLLKRDWKKILFFTIIGVAGIGLLLVKNIDFANLAERADGGRLQIWQQVLEKIDENPILGFGAAHKFNYEVTHPGGRVESVPHPHSIYLSTLMQGGVIGLFLLCVCIGLMTRQGYLVFMRDVDYSSLMVMLMGLYFGLYDHSGAYTNFSTVWLTFWVPFAVSAALEAQCRKTDL